MAALEIPAKFQKQAIVSPGPPPPGETPVYRHPSANPDFSKPPMQIPPANESHVVSTVAVFRKGMSAVGKDSPCLGQRFPGPDGKVGPFAFESYGKVEARSQDVGAALANLTGYKPGQDGIIGIFMNNTVEWVLTDLGSAFAGVVTATLYPTFDDPAIEYIFNLCNIPLVVLTPPQLPRLISLLPKIPTLKHAVVVDSPFAPYKPTATEHAVAKKAGVSLHTWTDFEALGHRVRAGKETDVSFLNMNSLYTLCFTSGTTGTPKGAMITHGNMVAVAYSVVLAQEGIMGSDTVHLSYMPMAHIYERLNMNVLFSIGAKVGVYRGDALLLFEDVQALQPSYFPSVPRILNRIVGQLRGMAQSLPPAEKASFDKAYEAKFALLRKGIVANDTEFDADPTMRKMKMILGGKMKVINSGAAPIAPENLDFMRVVFGCHVKEGYGQTENSASSHLLMTGDVWAPFGSTVGAVSPHAEFKLIDIPDMGYFAQPKSGNPRGEIWTRGASTCVGYFKAADKTAEALTSDGWLLTGDVGEVLPNLTLKIIDRKKHVFKLSQGEYVAPERVETIYLRNPALAQLYVHGDSLKSYLVCIAVPDPDGLALFASQHGIKGDFESLCSDPRVLKAVLDNLTELGKQEGLHGFEQPKAIRLHPEPFTPENGLLTPTAKSKRNELAKFFKPAIDQMYKEVGLD